MTDQPRDPGAILGAGTAPSVRPAPDASADEEVVGYARADLRDALARIRDASGPKSFGDRDRGRSFERSADDSVLDEVRALGAKVDRLLDLAGAASASSASASAAAAKLEERLANLSNRVDEARAAQSRASAPLLALTVAVVVLAAIVIVLVVVDVGPPIGS